MPLLNVYIYWDFDKLSIEILLWKAHCAIYCLSQPSNLEMSSDSTEEAETSHFTFLVIRVFSAFPTEIAVLCYHAQTNDIVLPDGRVAPSPLTKVIKTEIFLIKKL